MHNLVRHKHQVHNYVKHKNHVCNLVKQVHNLGKHKNQILCVFLNNTMFHQNVSVETIKNAFIE